MQELFAVVIPKGFLGGSPRVISNKVMSRVIPKGFLGVSPRVISNKVMSRVIPKGSLGGGLRVISKVILTGSVKSYFQRFPKELFQELFPKVL